MVGSVEFSVVVPVGHEDERLAIALRSLTIQKAKVNIALLDASGSDRMRRIADSFKNKLAIRRHRPDAGQAAAIQEGWQLIDGDILCWLNADDALLPGALRKIAEVFAAHPETDVVFGHSVVQDSRGWTTGYHMAIQDISDALYWTNLISQPSCFARRRAVDDVGGINPNLQYVMDWDLWVRLYDAGKKFHFIEEPISRVVLETGTKTASVAPRRLYEIFQLVRRHTGLGRALKTIIGFVAHHLGAYTALSGLRRKLRLRRSLSSRKPIQGLDQYGRIAHTATVPLANLGTSPMPGVAIQFERAEGGLESIAIGDFPVAGRRRNEMQAILPEPLGTGELRSLTIRALAGRGLVFVGAKLCDGDQAGAGSA